MHTFISNSGRDITFRPPTVKDTNIMLEYINTLGKEDIYLNVNPADLYTLAQEEIFVKNVVFQIERKQQVYFLAFHQHRLIGSCSITKGVRRRKHLGTFGITLSAGYRSDGIGLKLAQSIIESAQENLDINILILDVFAPNHPALNLYRKLGFVEYGRLPRGLTYQQNYIDSILMCKHL